MKRFSLFLLSFILLLSSMSIVNASETQETPKEQIVILEDGGYMVIQLDIHNNLSRATTSKSKIYTRYDADDILLWKATLTASFTYDGRTASCTSTSCSVTVYDSAWYTISTTDWADENIAKANIEMGRRTLGVTTKRETYNITLVCDRYGNVS